MVFYLLFIFSPKEVTGWLLESINILVKVLTVWLLVFFFWTNLNCWYRWNVNFGYLLHFADMTRRIRIIGHRIWNITWYHPFIQGPINCWWWKWKGPPELWMGRFLVPRCTMAASWSEWPCTRRSGSPAGSTFINFVLVHGIICLCCFTIPGTACKRAEWEESFHIPGPGWLTPCCVEKISGSAENNSHKQRRCNCSRWKHGIDRKTKWNLLGVDPDLLCGMNVGGLVEHLNSQISKIVWALDPGPMASAKIGLGRTEELEPNPR